MPQTGTALPNVFVQNDDDDDDDDDDVGFRRIPIFYNVTKCEKSGYFIKYLGVVHTSGKIRISFTTRR